MGIIGMRPVAHLYSCRHGTGINWFTADGPLGHFGCRQPGQCRHHSLLLTIVGLTLMLMLLPTVGQFDGRVGLVAQAVDEKEFAHLGRIQILTISIDQFVMFVQELRGENFAQNFTSETGDSSF